MRSSADSIPREKLKIIINQLVILSHQEPTENEKKIIDLYLESPLQLIELSGKELAERVQVHPSTVVRLAKKWGFNGYPELRRYLQQNTHVENDSATRHLNTLSNLDTHQSVLEQTIQQEIENLKVLKQTLTEVEIEKAANLILQADKIFTLGEGNNHTYSQHFSRRLKRSGFNSEAIPMSASHIAESLSYKSTNNIVILFFNNKVSKVIKKIITHSTNNNMKVIIISDLHSNKLPKDILLLRIYRGERTSTKTVSSALVLCNILIRTLTQIAPQSVLKGLESYDSVKEFLE